MRFLDANIFIYAFVSPKRSIDSQTAEAKKKSARILESQKEFCTSVVHLSEVANVIESLSNQEHATRVVSALLSTPSIKVLAISKENYTAATEIAGQAKTGVNDALAFVLMRANGVKEIHSFDKAFDKFPGIKRLEE